MLCTRCRHAFLGFYIPNSVGRVRRTPLIDVGSRLALACHRATVSLVSTTPYRAMAGDMGDILAAHFLVAQFTLAYKVR